MPVFVKSYFRKSGRVGGYVKGASGPHSVLRGLGDTKAKGVRVGGKTLTRGEYRAKAKAALARARQIQTVRRETLALRRG